MFVGLLGLLFNPLCLDSTDARVENQSACVGGRQTAGGILVKFPPQKIWYGVGSLTAK